MVMWQRSSTKITWLLILTNVIYFIYEIKMMGLNTIISGRETSQALLQYGAGLGVVDLTDQKYRLLTSMFMHASLDHIGSNMLTLFIFGRALEWRFGAVRYLIIYFISGIVGNIASSLINPNVVSVGASGAIFGVIGGLTISAFLTPKQTAIALGPMVFMVIWNLYDGFSDPSIDMLAHLGGLVSGVTLATLFIILEAIFHLGKDH